MLYFGLLTSFVLEYVRPGNFLPFINPLRLNTLLPLLVFAIAVFNSERTTNLEIFRHRNGRWITFLLFLLVVAILHANVTFFSFDVFKTVLSFLFLSFMVAKLVDSNERLKWFVGTLVFCHVALVALNPSIVTRPDVRSYLQGVTFLGDGNDFALSVVVVIPLCLYLFLDASGKLYKLLALASVMLLIVAIIGTSSRGATVAIGVVMIYLWWRGRAKMLGLIGFAVVAFGVWLYAPPEYFGRMETIASYQEEGSAMGRILAWKSAVRMANENPLTGVGTGHFPVKFGTEYRPPEYGDQPLPWLTAHSIYFLVLGELGYPGVIFLLGILYGNYRSGERIIRAVRKVTPTSPLARRYEAMFLCLNSSMIGFAVGGAFLSAVYYPHLYVISALYIATELMYRRDEAQIFAVSGVAATERTGAIGQVA